MFLSVCVLWVWQPVLQAKLLGQLPGPLLSLEAVKVKGRLHKAAPFVIGCHILCLSCKHEVYCLLHSRMGQSLTVRALLAYLGRG